MRKTFEDLLATLPGTQRTIPLALMKKAIETASTATDTADLHQNDQPEQGRPTVGEDELATYISKVNELWQEVCDTDASEVMALFPYPLFSSYLECGLSLAGGKRRVPGSARQSVREKRTPDTVQALLRAFSTEPSSARALGMA